MVCVNSAVVNCASLCDKNIKKEEKRQRQRSAIQQSQCRNEVTRKVRCNLGIFILSTLATDSLVSLIDLVNSTGDALVDLCLKLCIASLISIGFMGFIFST